MRSTHTSGRLRRGRLGLSGRGTLPPGQHSAARLGPLIKTNAPLPPKNFPQNYLILRLSFHAGFAKMIREANAAAYFEVIAGLVTQEVNVTVVDGQEQEGTE